MYVGYLGPSGSFTHNAALKAFPEAELVSLGTITEVIKSYEEGRVDYAMRLGKWITRSFQWKIPLRALFMRV